MVIMLNSEKIREPLYSQSSIFGFQIWRALAIDPARLNTSKGAWFARALTVTGHESVIQK
jgi:hypothetical protein